MILKYSKNVKMFLGALINESEASKTKNTIGFINGFLNLLLEKSL
jgi:hypothetical protein